MVINPPFNARDYDMEELHAQDFDMEELLDLHTRDFDHVNDLWTHALQNPGSKPMTSTLTSTSAQKGMGPKRLSWRALSQTATIGCIMAVAEAI